ncbi:alpha/beta fold hydrolase [Roseibium denhamense]|uniref:AB hydrolase-1 domain-containing protein n=1 Tax=Roseibium denhamense TaxID=76305 RepID=A0ABY1P4K7_9HYPH|nr:alpha/beta fold hydrolase [Roseibium denhamense]MTI07261.1 alpha/beta fold hydrolase [Roseibium denhamense]SMP26217.1 hypothetical protein SAMN06265374_2689 [Roseibium denhamense]
MKIFRRALLWLTGAISLIVLFGAGLLFLTNVSDFDLAGFKSENISFPHGGATISGTLHLPHEDNPPLLVLVHGDGPQDRYAGGSLLPLMRVLLENGIAVYSWDKPGIGASSGNWLDYSMQDRSELAAQAVTKLSSHPDNRFASIGILGFSQAGWVLPGLALRETAASHFILVGGAVNWLRQGSYFTRIRLEQEGVSDGVIEQIIAEETRRNRDIKASAHSYEAYLSSFDGKGQPMSENRFNFVRKNMNSDASETLRQVRKPFLTIHGSHDLNVDPEFNPQEYRRLLAAGGASTETVVIANATHGLLKADPFNYQLPDEMPIWTQAWFVLSGRNAYAPGALDQILSWTLQAPGHTPTMTGG